MEDFSNSRFIKLTDEYREAKIISYEAWQQLQSIYRDSFIDTSVIDKHAEKLIDQYTRNSLSTRSIQKNIQFIAWLLIINLTIIFCYFVYLAFD